MSLSSITDKFIATDPVDGFAKSKLVQEFCVEARNHLLSCASSNPLVAAVLLADESFQRTLDLLDVTSPEYGIGTDMGRAVRLYNKAATVLNALLVANA